MKRFFIFLIIILCGGLIGWQAYKKSVTPPGPGRSPKGGAVAVDVAEVRRTSIRDIGVFTGTLDPRAQFMVAPKIAGRLERLFLNIGDPVGKGQLVAVLDGDEYLQQADQFRAELEVAQATLEESRISLEIAKREYERTEALREKKIASESELDSARAQYNNQQAKYKVALALVAQKKAALNAAEIRLSYARIHAAWEDDGGDRVVGERFVDEGAMLAPNTPILSILDINSVIAVIHIIERDYSMIQPGKEADMSTDAYPGKVFTGKVVRVAPLLKEKSRQARVEIDIPNPESLLKPGMFVRVKIVFAQHENATVVPQTSLVKRDGKEGVFLVDTKESRVRFLAITKGIVNGEAAEILSPSLSGRVVTMGHHLLEDGTPVMVSGDKSDQGERETGRADSSGKTDGKGSGKAL